MLEDSHNDSNLLRGKVLWGFETDLFEGVNPSFSLVISKLVDIWDIFFLEVVEKVHFLYP
jgi:hypothetical protein